MLTPNLITPTVLPHFQAALEAALPHPMHTELRTIFENIRPLNGALTPTDQGRVLGLHAFWRGEPGCSNASLFPDAEDIQIHNGFQEGWLAGAREYCQQANNPAHAAFLRSLAEMDQEILEITRRRNAQYPRSETRFHFEQQIITERYHHFLHGRGAARERRMNEFERLDLGNTLLAADRTEQFGIPGLLQTLFGWTLGALMLSSWKNAGRTPPYTQEAWLKNIQCELGEDAFKELCGLFPTLSQKPDVSGRLQYSPASALINPRQIDNGWSSFYSEFLLFVLPSYGHVSTALLSLYQALFLQLLPDETWLYANRAEKKVVRLGDMRRKGFFPVYAETSANEIKLTRLGKPLAKQMLKIGDSYYYLSDVIEEQNELFVTIKKIESKHPQGETFPEAFSFRVHKPHSQISRSKFWELISEFLENQNALQDTSWDTQTYNLSAYLEMLALEKPSVFGEMKYSLVGSEIQVAGQPWRLFLTEDGEFWNQRLYSYVARNEGAEVGVSEVSIRMTPLAPGQFETIQKLLEEQLPALHPQGSPSQNFPFGDQGQVWRLR